jgi:hypothetical protein
MPPNNVNILGQSNAQCASGEKKLLLLSQADQMADEQTLTTFVTNSYASHQMSNDNVGLYKLNPVDP